MLFLVLLVIKVSTELSQFYFNSMSFFILTSDQLTLNFEFILFYKEMAIDKNEFIQFELKSQIKWVNQNTVCPPLSQCNCAGCALIVDAVPRFGN